MVSLTCRTFLFADNCWICSLVNLFFPFGIQPIPSGRVHYTIYSVPFQSAVQAGASSVRSTGMSVHLLSERQGSPVLGANLPVRSTGYSLKWVHRGCIHGCISEFVMHPCNSIMHPFWVVGAKWVHGRISWVHNVYSGVQMGASVGAWKNESKRKSYRRIER